MYNYRVDVAVTPNAMRSIKLMRLINGSFLYKESCDNKPMYGYMLPNLSPSPNYTKYRVFTITM